MKEDPFQRTKFQQKNLWVTFLILFWGVTKYLLEIFQFFMKKIDFYQELFDTFSILTWINFTILGSFFFESLNSHKMV